jgi:hypothetical protein
MGRAACEDQQTPDQPEYPTTSQSCLVDGQWHLLYKAAESVCLIYEAAMMVDVGLATEPTQTPLSDIPYSVRFSGQSAQSALSQSSCSSIGKRLSGNPEQLFEAHPKDGLKVYKSEG